MIISMKNISKSYDKTDVIKNLDLTIKDKEFTTLLGPSGYGKTTILRMIAGLETPSAGEIYFDDICVYSQEKKINLPPERRNIGFVFQDFNLLDTLTAYENIALALTIIKTPVKQIEAKVNYVAKALGISEILKKYPYQLSGGQKQRVACARAIITQPSLILADEPTGALDSKSARMLLESFETLNHDLSATILMVTHDAFTASYCHRILFIKDGKIFNELIRGNSTRKEFFDKIISVVTLLGGDNSNVF